MAARACGLIFTAPRATGSREVGIGTVFGSARGGGTQNSDVEVVLYDSYPQIYLRFSFGKGLPELCSQFSMRPDSR
jgi:hypothetical protein